MSVPKSPETESLLYRVAAGFELTLEEHLKLSVLRPLPTWFEKSILMCAYVTKFSAADDHPVRNWHLHFLRQRLSSAIFNDLISPLRDDDTAVTYEDIRRLYLRKRRLNLLRKKVRELQIRRNIALSQKQFAKS